MGSRNGTVPGASDHPAHAQRAGAVFLTAPDLIWLEIANVLWKAARRRTLSKNLATEALIGPSSSVSISTLSSAALRDDALAIAVEYNCAVYDAAYLALAMNSGLPMITADERSSAPWLRVLPSNGSALSPSFHPNLEGCPIPSPLP